MAQTQELDASKTLTKIWRVAYLRETNDFQHD